MAGAFYGCTSLERIVVPSSVTSICARTFKNCTGLIDVELHEGTAAIMEYAFYNCTSLTRIRVPSSVKVLHRKSFCGCKQLMNVEFCEGLEFVGVTLILWLHVIRAPERSSLRQENITRGVHKLPKFGCSVLY